MVRYGKPSALKLGTLRRQAGDDFNHEQNQARSEELASAALFLNSVPRIWCEGHHKRSLKKCRMHADLHVHLSASQS